MLALTSNEGALISNATNKPERIVSRKLETQKTWKNSSNLMYGILKPNTLLKLENCTR
jgi:hypothetical protein